MLEKFKTAFSSMSALAGKYLPRGFKEAMLDQAKEVDQLRADVDALKNQLKGN
jgi:hypothetical protein